jgi:hypothetical protein
LFSRFTDWTQQVLHNLCKTSKHHPLRRIVGPLSAQTQQLLHHPVTKRENICKNTAPWFFCIGLLPHYFGTINQFSKKTSNQQLYAISSTGLL